MPRRVSAELPPETRRQLRLAQAEVDRAERAAAEARERRNALLDTAERSGVTYATLSRVFGGDVRDLGPHAIEKAVKTRRKARP